MHYPFTKMQAIGNDFVVVEENAWTTGTDWAAQAIRLCDRRSGVGGDGLLVVYPTGTAEFGMRMYNPDGTEDMCGNGLRCVIAFAVEKNGAATQGTVATLAGLVPYTYEHGFGEVPNHIATTLGVPKWTAADLPMTFSAAEPVVAYPLALPNGETVSISSVNTGTTHTVVWVDELPDDETFFRISPLIENHVLFPERTSVLWATMDEWRNIRLRIWERGVGETLGCGTGAAAAYSVAAREGRDPIGKVYSRGGVLDVSGGGDTGVTLRGAAYTVFAGTIPAQ